MCVSVRTSEGSLSSHGINFLSEVDIPLLQLQGQLQKEPYTGNLVDMHFSDTHAVP